MKPRITRENMNAFCRTCLDRLQGKQSIGNATKHDISQLIKSFQITKSQWCAKAFPLLDEQKFENCPRFLCKGCYKSVCNFEKFHEMVIQSMQTLTEVLGGQQRNVHNSGAGDGIEGMEDEAFAMPQPLSAAEQSQVLMEIYGVNSYPRLERDVERLTTPNASGSPTPRCPRIRGSSREFALPTLTEKSQDIMANLLDTPISEPEKDFAAEGDRYEDLENECIEPNLEFEEEEAERGPEQASENDSMVDAEPHIEAKSEDSYSQPKCYEDLKCHAQGSSHKRIVPKPSLDPELDPERLSKIQSELDPQAPGLIVVSHSALTRKGAKSFHGSSTANDSIYREKTSVYAGSSVPLVERRSISSDNGIVIFEYSNELIEALTARFPQKLPPPEPPKKKKKPKKKNPKIKRIIFKKPILPKAPVQTVAVPKPEPEPQRETFDCPECHRRFKRHDNLTAHLRTHQGLKPFPCAECDRCFTKRYSLRMHIQECHMDVKQIPCDFPGCGKVFTREASYKVHYRNFHTGAKPEEKVYVCEECGRLFKNITVLKEHQYSHAPIDEHPFKCNPCNKRFTSHRTFKEHQLRHSGVKNFECEYCGLKKTTRHELRTHVNYHTRERQWNCPNCPSVFNSSANLGLHDRVVHQGIRKFACHYCDQRFGKPDTLKHHEMRHTGERPHGCEICGRRFIQMVALRAHMRTHEKNGEVSKKPESVQKSNEPMKIRRESVVQVPSIKASSYRACSVTADSKSQTKEQSPNSNEKASQINEDLALWYDKAKSDCKLLLLELNEF